MEGINRFECNKPLIHLQADLEVKSLKDKVTLLEKEVVEIKNERDEANERADELQQATQDLLVKIESYKNNSKNVKRV